jgi:hypothetical protein
MRLILLAIALAVVVVSSASAHEGEHVPDGEGELAKSRATIREVGETRIIE